MRLISPVRCALCLSLMSCRGEPQRTAAASTSDSTNMFAARPDPVITDSTAIYVAHGGPPAWRVEILGEGIRYRWGDNRTGVVFPAGRVDGDDSSSVWIAKRTADGPKSLQMQILRQPCRIPGNDSAFAYKVALIVDEANYLGCAVAGPHAPSNNPANRR